MKITVINGTEKHGVTYRLKEIFLARFRSDAEITEYYLPKDCPAFCMGCTSCISKGTHTCKDAAFTQKIAASLLESDLIIMTDIPLLCNARDRRNESDARPLRLFVDAAPSRS